MADILRSDYVLAVPDLKRAAAFYVDVLGFEVTAEPPGWLFVQRDNCVIRLGECPDDMHPSDLGCHNYFAYLCVTDVDAWHDRLKRRGVTLLSEPTNQPWQMREFGIASPDGHRIMIGQQIG